MGRPTWDALKLAAHGTLRPRTAVPGSPAELRKLVQQRDRLCDEIHELEEEVADIEDNVDALETELGSVDRRIAELEGAMGVDAEDL